MHALRYGLDIDDEGLVEGAWTTRTLDITGQEFVSLFVGLSADVEFALFDEIMITTNVPAPDFCAISPCQNAATCSMVPNLYSYKCSCVLPEGQVGFVPAGGSTLLLQDGWHRLTVVSGGANTTFFVDGEASTLQAKPEISMVFSIGNDYSQMKRGWGFMSRFRLYNDSLTESDIAYISAQDDESIPSLAIAMDVEDGRLVFSGTAGFDTSTGGGDPDKVVNIVGSPTVVEGPDGAQDGVYFGSGDVLILGRGGVAINASWTVDVWFKTPVPFSGTFHTLLRSTAGDQPIAVDDRVESLYGHLRAVGSFVRGHVGYEGPNCDVEIADECLSSPCDPAAVCIDGIGSYSCLCPTLLDLETHTLDESCNPILALIAFTSFSEPANGVPMYTRATSGGEMGFDDLQCTYQADSNGQYGVTLNANYRISDTKQFCSFSFEPVSLHEVRPAHLKLRLFVARTVWPPEDFIRIWVEVDGGQKMWMLNTQGSDMGIQNLTLGDWTTLYLDLSGHSAATLHFGLRSSSSSQFVMLDEVMFTTWRVFQNVIAYSHLDLPALGATSYTSEVTHGFDMFAPTVDPPAGELGFMDADGITPTCGALGPGGGVTSLGYLGIVNPGTFCYFVFDDFEVRSVDPNQDRVYFQLSVFVSHADWEQSDYVQAYLLIEGQRVWVVDTLGYDIDEYAGLLGLEEGIWSVFRLDLTEQASGNTNIQLVLGFVSDDDSKYVLWDEPVWMASLEDLDFCSSSPCQNGGTCTSPLYHFICTCAQGFDGATCESVAEDDCSSSPCMHGGTCTDREGAYDCSCPVLFGLRHFPLDDNCQGQQSIVGYTSFSDASPGSASYSPSSPDGELGFTASESTGCSFFGGYGVTEEQFYKIRNADGELCYVQLDTVNLSTLEDGAVAHFEVRVFLPDVDWGPDDYVRVWLIVDGDPDPLVILDTSGSDLNDAGSGLTEGEWTVVATPSNRLRDRASMTAYFGILSHELDQFILFDDVTISTWLSPVEDLLCQSNPCQNGATCSVPLYRYIYVCDCAVGFEGVDCEHDVTDECASNPCGHGGTCVDGIQGYTCICQLMYGLTTLQLDENCYPLKNLVAYSSFSEPATGQTEYFSTVVGGEMGFATSGCESVLLDGIGGHGVTADDEYSFSDTDGFCSIQLEPVPMASIPVLELHLTLFISDTEWTDQDRVRIWVEKGATVQDLLDTKDYDLDLYAWRWNLMERRWVDLRYYILGDSSSLVVHIGADLDAVNNQYAHTTEISAGDKYVRVGEVALTTMRLREEWCGSSPCLNGGTCIQPLFLYECLCMDGYEGPNCEAQVADECASDPCLNGGTCSDGSQEYSCACPINTEGSRCETSSCLVYVEGTTRCAVCSNGLYAFSDGLCRQIDTGQTVSDFPAMSARFTALQAQIIEALSHVLDVAQNITASDGVTVPLGNTVQLLGPRGGNPYSRTIDLSLLESTPFVAVAMGAALQVESLMFHGSTTGVVSCEGTFVVGNSVFQNNSNALGSGGGAVTASGASVSITGSAFSGNTAEQGGAVLATDSEMSVSSCTFRGNSASSGGSRRLQDSVDVPSGGGALHWSKTDMTNGKLLLVDSCTFEENVAQQGSGGAVFIQAAAFASVDPTDSSERHSTFKDVSFIQNDAHTGGAVAVASSFPHATRKADHWLLRLDHVDFKNNTASASGGAVDARDTTVTSISGSFAGNTADTGSGGALHSSSSIIVIQENAFAQNSANFASGRGGAIHSEEDEIEVVRTSFVSHSAGFGGAVDIGTGSTMAADECDLDSNLAAVEGGSIFSAGTLYLTSTSITRNVAQTRRGGAISSSGSLHLTLCNLTHNFVGAGQVGSGGGIYSAGATRLDTTLFDTNVAHSGGAIYSTSDLFAQDTNFTQNNASVGSGGAVYAKSGTATIQGVTFYCNYAEQSPSSTALFSDSSMQTVVANNLFDGQLRGKDFFGRASLVACGDQIASGGIVGCDDPAMSNAGKQGSPLRPCDQGDYGTLGTSWGQCSETPGQGVSCDTCPHGMVSLDGIQCTFCPGGSIPGESQSSCDQCSPFEYSDDGLQCKQCAPGLRPVSGLTGCESCPFGRYSDTGSHCKDCDPGYQVNENRTNCTICSGPGEFSDTGKACMSCGVGSRPMENRTGCVLCDAGSYSGDGTECTTCPVRHKPNAILGATGCTPCLLTEYGADGIICQTCPPGQELNADRLGCDNCTEPGVFSGDGVQCRACDPGKEPAGNRTTCVACEAGKMSRSGIMCSPCSAGFEPNPTRVGCNSCQGTYSSDGTLCIACLPGTEPNQTLAASSCQACAPGLYSATGVVCTVCDPGHEPSIDQVSCTACRTGTYSSDGLACQACTQLFEPNADIGATACDACAIDHYGPDGLECKRCDAGYELNASRTGCDKCSEPGMSDPGSDASEQGVQCQQCRPGTQPNVVWAPLTISGGWAALALGCRDCLAGQHSVSGVLCSPCEGGFEPTAARTGCQACQGKYSPDGTACLDCPAGYQPNGSIAAQMCDKCGNGTYSSDGVVCTVCDPGYQPSLAQDACEECEFGQYSADGQACKICSEATRPNAVRAATGCDLCPSTEFGTDGVRCGGCSPGQMLNAARTGCLNCTAPGHHSADGILCRDCPSGSEPTLNRTACAECSYGKQSNGHQCRVCEPGSQPSARKSACEVCTAQYSPTGEECFTCPVGTEPNARIAATNCTQCSFGQYSPNGVQCSVCDPGYEPTPDTCSNATARTEEDCMITPHGLCSISDAVFTEADCVALGSCSEPTAISAQQCAQAGRCSLPLGVDSQQYPAVTTQQDCNGLGVCSSPQASNASSCSAVYTCSNVSATTSTRCSEVDGVWNQAMWTPAVWTPAVWTSANATWSWHDSIWTPAQSVCLPCRFGTYSTDGRQCLQCEHVYKPNYDLAATGCSPCSATQYGPDGVHCLSCATGQQINSARTGCEPCAAPAQYSNDGVSCKVCGPGQEPFDDRTGCAVCGRGNYSTSGVVCDRCRPGYRPSLSRASCIPCSVGTQSAHGKNEPHATFASNPSTFVFKY
jgi:predicted outer membrane repeat protein